MKAVNLIPSEQRAAVKPVAGKPVGAPDGGSAAGAYAILGFLVLAIVAAALYVMAGNTVSEREAEVAQAEQEATAVEQQASSLQSFADFKQLADARVSTVTALASARFDWEGALDDVSRALPSDVYVNSLDGATSSASSGSSLRGAITAPSIELTGCTKDQSSVARMLSSLREVRGVTRVTLAKSEAVDTTATAAAPETAADGEDAAVTTEPCPAGSPPAFDVIAFFERAALSPNAAPNPGAPLGAGPTGPTGPTGPAGTTTTTTSTTTP